MNITTTILKALCQLGYESPSYTIVIIPISPNRFRVTLNGEYFGIWDDDKNTFVD